MVDQLPNLGREKEMLEAMGMKEIADLFSDLPKKLLWTKNYHFLHHKARKKSCMMQEDYSEEMSHWSKEHRFWVQGCTRTSYLQQSSNLPFGEFLTSYTPYQPEVSQGMLQSMWKFQTLISELVELPIANLSMYDGSTAAAEALTIQGVLNRKAEQKRYSLCFSFGATR